MKKIVLKATILAISLQLALSSFAFAAGKADIIENDAVLKKIVIEGQDEKFAEDGSVRIQLVRSEAAGNTVTGALDIKNNFVLFREIPVGKDGKYKVTVNMDGIGAGEFQIRVNGQAEGVVYYCTVEEKMNLVNDIISICNTYSEENIEGAVTALMGKIKFYNYDLQGQKNGIALSAKILNLDTNELIYKIADKTENSPEAQKGLFRALYKEVRKKVFSTPESNTNRAAELDECIKKASYSEALNLYTDKNGAVLKTIEEYNLAYALDSKYLSKYKSEAFTASMRENFIPTYFKGKGYASYAEISEAFKNGVLDTIYKNGFKSWGEVEDFITDFGSDCGINMTAYNSTQMTTYEKSILFGYIIDTPTDNFDDFIKKINDKIAVLTAVVETPSYESFGGGGGGGSGMKVTPPVAPIEPVIENKNDEVLYSDMEDFEWAKEAVYALNTKGIINGVGENRYEPEREVKREEFVKMIALAFEIEKGEKENCFTDVKDGEWYYGYIIDAYSLGIINGDEDGNFGTGRSISREDAAVIIYRAVNVIGKELNASEEKAEFTDNNKISDYAKEAVSELYKRGYISGKNDNRFDSKASLTRAEAAKLIYEMIK